MCLIRDLGDGQRVCISASGLCNPRKRNWIWRWDGKNQLCLIPVHTAFLQGLCLVAQIGKSFHSLNPYIHTQFQVNKITFVMVHTHTHLTSHHSPQTSLILMMPNERCPPWHSLSMQISGHVHVVRSMLTAVSSWRWVCSYSSLDSCNECDSHRIQWGLRIYIATNDSVFW